jgi:hypothetical protein
VYRAAQTTITSPSQVTSVTNYIEGLASDGTNVYVGTNSLSGPGVLYYAPVGGGPAQVLYTSTFTAESSIAPGAAVGGAVYFADTDLSQCPSSTVVRGIATP